LRVCTAALNAIISRSGLRPILDSGSRRLQPAADPALAEALTRPDDGGVSAKIFETVR
jgi:hypothetical protein